MTAPRITTCDPWCNQHITLTLEAADGEPAPVMHSTIDDGPTGEPVIVTWVTGGTGHTLTLDQARQRRDQLDALIHAAEVTS